MPITATNLIQGPAVVYAGLFGATEPATIATAPGAGWTDVGATKGGVELEFTNETVELEVDQTTYPMGSKVTKRGLLLKTSLAEATLTNLALAIANGAPVANVLNATDDATAYSPGYGAILLDGIAPGGFKRRVILRRTLPTEAVTVAYKKDEQTVLAVSWKAHWVSASIVPWKIEDATS